ncbi:MAG: SDR family oxidoreductase [Trebonia sp.]
MNGSATAIWIIVAVAVAGLAVWLGSVALAARKPHQEHAHGGQLRGTAVSNAARQMTHDKLEDITDEEWDRTLAVNLSAFFYLTKAALPHMRPGASIIGTSSVNSDSPTPALLPYDVTKAGIANMTAALAQLLAPRGIRANSVAPGPVWTSLIPSTMPAEHVESFGSSSPFGRPGQPAEVAPVYVMLASDEASYVSGARVAVTGGKPIL